MAAGETSSASAMPPMVITTEPARKVLAGPARSIAQPAGSAAAATKMPIIEVNQPISTSEKPISFWYHSTSGAILPSCMPARMPTSWRTMITASR